MKKFLLFIVFVMSLCLNFFQEQLNYTYMKLAAIILPILVTVYWGAIGFYAPVWPLLGYLIALGGIDLITGIWAALREGQEIVSEFFWRRKAAVIVLFVFGLTTMLLMDKMIKEAHQSMPSFLYVAFMLFYGAYEAISILENISRIGDLKGIPAIIKMFKKKMPDDVKEALEDDKKD